MKNCLLIFVSIIVAAALSELFLRLSGVGSFSIKERVLFMTLPSFVENNRVGVRYSPNSRVRSVAIYGDHIDYDVTFETNNMGFVDLVPYENKPSKHQVAFVGDSFTASSGSSVPWVVQLRETSLFTNAQLFNFGVGGTGVLAFVQRLNALLKEFDFQEVIFVVISDDFYRVLWAPVATDDGVWFCPKIENYVCPNSPVPTISSMEYADSKSSLLARASRIYEQASPKIEESMFLRGMKEARIYTLACDVLFLKFGFSGAEMFCPHLRNYRLTERTKNIDIFANSVNAMAEIVSEHPEIKFRVFHVPEKSEVVSRKYSVDLTDEMRSVGVEYHQTLFECNWDRSLYFKNDAHLNPKGYSFLANCFRNIFNRGTK